jgi:hypothetical protein
MIPKPQVLTQESRRRAFDVALRTLPRAFGPSEVYTWMREHASWIEDAWIDGRLAADTVNDPRRQHMPGPRDLLYGRADGRFERYDPTSHGWWSTTGRPTEAPTSTATVTRLMVASTASGSSASAKHGRSRRAG